MATRLTPQHLKSLLLEKIDEQKNVPDYISKGAFTRKGKISFQQAMLFPLLSIQKGNLMTEMTELFDLSNLPSVSALCQKRQLISADAFKSLFHSFTNALPLRNNYKGLRLIAVDGTRLNIPYNPKDTDTFIQNIEDRKGCNQMHMISLADILNNAFLDASFQYGNKLDEFKAYADFLDGFHNDQPCLFISDRGFCSFNNFAHAIHNDQLFLHRLNSSMDLNKYTDSAYLDREEFDAKISITLARFRKKRSTQPQNFHFIGSKRTYDYLPAGSKETDTLSFRYIKFRLDNGSYEYLATNLPNRFTLSDIKTLYALRWQIETNFRHLKYAEEMIYVHSLKRNLTLQEIYGKLTLFNFCMAMVSLTDSASAEKKETNLYRYAVNKKQAVRFCFLYIRGKCENVLQLIESCKLPVRPGRAFPRKLRRQAAVSLFYR